MQKHTKVYLDHFGLGEQDFIPCEICGTRAVDIHHLERRGMGGSGTKDYIENLMGLCRLHHIMCEGDLEYNERAKKIHFEYLEKSVYL